MSVRARSLRLRGELSELERLAAAVAEIGQGLPGETLRQVELAAEELVTNVIAHNAGAADPIEVELTVGGGRFTLRVSDGGAPFDPLAHPDADVHAPIEERKVGGLGLMLVRRLMDEVQYERRDGRNVIRVAKGIPWGVAGQ